MTRHLQIVKHILMSRVIVRNLILFVVIGAMVPFLESGRVSAYIIDVFFDPP
jgi:hypothetical protein